jgi:3,4-dihydroxy-2-butanone 4-phosphate synthase
MMRIVRMKVDLVIAAEMVTPEAVNFMATYARGLLCRAMTGERNYLEEDAMHVNSPPGDRI